MISKWLAIIRIRLIYWLWPGRSWSIEGNSHTLTCFIGSEKKYQLTFFTLSEPTTYGRESVYRMLKLVRDEERRMGWKCPEPYGYVLKEPPFELPLYIRETAIIDSRGHFIGNSFKPGNRSMEYLVSLANEPRREPVEIS